MLKKNSCLKKFFLPKKFFALKKKNSCQELKRQKGKKGKK